MIKGNHPYHLSVLSNSLSVETRCFASQLRVSASRLSFASQLRVSASRIGFKETQGIASKRGIAFWFQGDARHRVLVSRRRKASRRNEASRFGFEETRGIASLLNAALCEKKILRAIILSFRQTWCKIKLV